MCIRDRVSTQSTGSEETGTMSGVTKDIIEEGNGDVFPKSGDKLKMHYTGTLAEGGKQFDSSRDRGQLFEFTIGVGQVIKGWDEGVMQMSLGERATLNISSEFGYGSSGAGADIPPNADLKFDVRLVAINKKQAFYSEKHVEVYQKKLDTWKETELKKYDEKEEYKTKKDEKHGDRAGFETFIDETIATSMAAVPMKPTDTW
eukprot:TRINITY_DN44022_c0_g1_i1.p1 TRINITY_DN44022_c0_g1~~TRINITY_DN44022_c0_g1_i1.p1  ORF type:complete len:202 (+),score=75.97 TRINITY_DN44022_c0_g1_i1:151-756(+)